MGSFDDSLPSHESTYDGSTASRTVVLFCHRLADLSLLSVVSKMSALDLDWRHRQLPLVALSRLDHFPRHRRWPGSHVCRPTGVNLGYKIQAKRSPRRPWHPAGVRQG